VASRVFDERCPTSSPTSIARFIASMVCAISPPR
jgi:hypothetical protein